MNGTQLKGAGSLPELAAIWAQARNGVIGRNGDMPWYAPEDLAHFKAATLGAPVIMGRVTWDSFPPRFRPLPGRLNLVITRSVSQVKKRTGPFGFLPSMRLWRQHNVWFRTPPPTG